MTHGDSLDSALRALDDPAEPRPAFADALRTRALEALFAPAESVRRVRRRRGRVRVAVLVGAILVALATIASAAYLAARSPAPPRRPHAGQLTLPRTGGGGNGTASIAAIGPGSRVTTLWRCAQRGFCGVITSLAWSPDGERVAFTLTQLGGRSGYIGLHILDLRTGKDLHIPDLPQLDPTRVQSAAVLGSLYDQLVRRLGCAAPDELAWSPDSQALAYACTTGSGSTSAAPERSRIFIVRADGSGRQALPSGVAAAYWPTWSPDGTQIAFATGRVPRTRVRSSTGRPYRTVRSSVYAVALDGSRRRLLVREATAPSWSPDGRAIAYQGACGGLGLVSPAGDTLTPGAEPGSCAAIGRPGPPRGRPTDPRSRSCLTTACT